MPLVFGFSVYHPCETSLKSCNLLGVREACGDADEGQVGLGMIARDS